MFKTESHSHSPYVNLSIEALWLARAIQDGLDVLLVHPSEHAFTDRDPSKVLGVSRDVFERLGAYGHSNGSVNSQGIEWSAAARTEFIRQVAVHWRAFMDASFGMTCASELIMSLTDYEISVLEQVLRLDNEIRANEQGVVFCMSQELKVKSREHSMRRALRCSVYLDPVQSRMR
jgi:hypothetical protein